jgi:hypothetical protein
MKTIEQRVQEAFSGDLRQEYSDEYLRSIRENARYADEKFHRSILLLLFFIAIFELLTRASIAEASIGPFKINVGVTQLNQESGTYG